ncbi:MAG: hydantoinase B/oxoprolinase family protein [Actinomycetota bacterium]
MTLDPISLSVLSAVLSGIAEEMGALLIRAAYSSNIKERRDCSTALFDATGQMVAQAEHIPVHLGAMPEAVAAVMDRDPSPGDVFALNDPYSGGTHLPDITLVAPIVHQREAIGYAVSRAHHSDVGGMRPGSMPADSTEIYQEGLILPPVRLVAGGREVEDTLALILSNSRTPSLRRADLRAQIASTKLAQARVEELMERRGRDVVLAAFTEIVGYTERRVRAAIAALDDGVYRAETEIEGDGVGDDDFPIEVAVEISGEEMAIDFEGTAPAVRGNVNCPLSVTRAACHFALRVLLPEDVPTNSGAHRPVDIRAPEGSLVNARSPSAVVAGNVETSQRIADAVLAALAHVADVPAEGQGTMNNVVIGGAGWTYYETIGGGQGANSRGPGSSGVHVGMTNTLNTPIEALELEFPLRVEQYELRHDSGGAGAHRGGDGIVRAVKTLQAAHLSLLSDRRRHGPAGRAGGSGGRPGRNAVNGHEIGAKENLALEAGDVVTIETPGGGGFGNRGRKEL